MIKYDDDAFVVLRKNISLWQYVDVVKMVPHFFPSITPFFGYTTIGFFSCEEKFQLHTQVEEIINCSKFDCSKKLVDTIFQLLDTIQANVTFLSTGQIRLTFGNQLDLSSFTFSQKNRLGQVRLGQVRLGQVRLGQVR